MDTLLIALASAVGFVVAYNTYGKYLARKIFQINPDNLVPSRQFEDSSDFVPTPREVVFGHHFTSIAGTGPIVGPAIAVFWGWLPALLWVVFGSIFIGAVHDFGALIVSIRSRGQSIGEAAGRLISPRARILFLSILFCSLTVVIGIFGLVIAVLFSVYPESVLSIWIEIPIAIAIGFWIHKKGGKLLLPSLGAVVLLYAAIYLGVYHLPIRFEGIPVLAGPGTGFPGGLHSSVVYWTVILLAYGFMASTLPVWTLLQPRDYINSHQLLLAMGLLCLGLIFAQPELVAPAINNSAPADAPAIFPFLFITIACGAISGFHCLVSSGTTSKQIRSEGDALFIGYGSMLLEGFLAVLVILACCAGVGLGVTAKIGGETVTGAAAWSEFYGGTWGSMQLAQKVGAFVKGGANMIAALGIAKEFAVGIMAVLVASFAATTLDTATRLQRYVVQELGAALDIPFIKGKYTATSIAVLTGGLLALIPGPKGPGSGGLILWPLFGATNQLLAGLAFLVIAFWLIRLDRPVSFLFIPAALMIGLPAWAMCYQIADWYASKQWNLFGIGIAVEVLQVWMIVEGSLMWKKARGVPAPEFAV